MSKKIGLFFGSFNPIHIGHLIIASYIIEHTDRDEIWMVVSPLSPFKKQSGLASQEHRFRMVQLATKQHRMIKANNIEFELPKPSYTIDTMKQLHSDFPDHHFSIIVGSDNLKLLPKWKNAKSLIRKYHFLVYLRSGYHLGEWKDHPRIHLLQAPLLNISSTYIRQQISEGKRIHYLVNKEVRAYIKKHKLYRTQLPLFE